jgi:diacylglycerol O-acyltransferase / wax synthase
VPTIDRLSGLDAAFLDLDSPHAPLHVGWTIRVAGRPPSLSALRRHIEGRLEHVPRFRRRVVRPRLGLGDAHWADDPGFDVARHVHAVTLAAPAGTRELRDLAGALLSQPLDPCHPLWRIYLVGGLRAGGWAVIGQAHHALVDGIAAIEVAMLLFDAAGHPPMRAANGNGWSPRPLPSTRASAAAFARDRVTGATRVARTAAATVARGADLPAAVRQLAAPAPATGLDRSATRRRAVAFAEVPLEAVRAAGRRHNATINDVLLAAATLAIGRALRRRGERPGIVKVLVPVNVRNGSDPGALGNRISFVTVELPVGTADQVEVLRAVRTQTRARKAGGAAAPLHTLAEVADLLPGGARRIVARTAARAASFNAVVSNVPGPPVDIEILGRRVTAIFPAVPFLHGHALSIGALSYRGRLHCGIYADATVVPDSADLARDLASAFVGLRAVPRPADTPWRARARSRRQRAAIR